MTFLLISQLNNDLEHIGSQLELKHQEQGRNEDFEANWESIYWSFMARCEGCARQKWHMDSKKGYFLVYPLYPYGYNPNWMTSQPDYNYPDLCGYYDVYVIKGSHKLKWNERLNKKENEKNVMCLNLVPGQVLIADAKLIHAGGPNASTDDMMGTTNCNDPENYIGAIKNLSIHAYLLHEDDYPMGCTTPTTREAYKQKMMKTVGEHTVFAEIEEEEEEEEEQQQEEEEQTEEEEEQQQQEEEQTEEEYL